MDELRLEWRRRADAAEHEIMGKYYSRRTESGGFGHEGLGVYGKYKEKLACRKVELAVKLLEREGLEVTTDNIRKLTRQTRTLSRGFVPTPPKQERQEEQADPRGEGETARVIPFLRRP